MSTIQQLPVADTIEAGDAIPFWSNNGGNSQRISVTLLADKVNELVNTTGYVSEYVQVYSSPSSTGFTATVTDGTDNYWLILTPTGTMSTGTIVLPTSPTDNQQVMVFSTQIVTTLTISSAKTVTGGPTALAANGTFTLKYCAVNSSWYRVN